VSQTAPDTNELIFPEDMEAEGDAHYVSHFIDHYWPMLLFGVLFLGTLSLPMILSGALPVEGLCIIGFFLASLAISLLVPQFMGIFLLIGAGIIMLVYPVWTYSTAGPGLYLLLGYSFVGGVLFAVSKVSKTKRQQKALKTGLASGGVSPLADVAVDTAVESAAPATTEVAKPKTKPVAFDLGIAASGITILFGTESGNSEELAKMAGTALQNEGYAVQILDNEVVDADHLKAFANVLMLTSTWGDGDPPSNTVDMMAKLKSPGYTLDMKGSQFSVLAMGDTNYEQFCKCGKEFDDFFANFGASRLYNRVDCDLDYETPFQNWLEGVKAAFKSAGLKTIPEYVASAEPELVTA